MPRHTCPRMNLRVFFVVAALFFMLFPAQADAHSLFNSAEEFIGGYRVQIATLPKSYITTQIHIDYVIAGGMKDVILFPVTSIVKCRSPRVYLLSCMKNTHT